MLHRFIFALAAFLTISIGVNAQLVKGKVVDATNGSPINNASIYLNGSSKGTISNAQGEFALKTTETNIPLIISCVGYQSEVIVNYSNKVLNITLKPRVNELREVVVGGMSREEQLKIFTTQFIGSTNKDCIITNPDDIDFRYRKKTKVLEAEASQPLIIYNKKLGYKITYFLSAFRYTPEEIAYQGNLFFEEDTLGLKPADVKKLFKARKKAYLGSRMHFIRSLWANELKQNEFTITAYSNTSEGTGNTYEIRNINGNELYNSSIIIRSGQKFFSPKSELVIKYKKDISSITLLPLATETIIASNGYNGNKLIWGGNMLQQRMNVLLPYEFKL